ncbi:hypothetical protein CC86DRAFT_411678 [Ophiobolus disseminans]|uniref:Uncharacterized protein n=1 Tax=Ophiobolus disseminans TaxID=1469910 RepID=A0A6A6ZI87_9PLEO|nr:hypothetical protein CC86DRAFT_411678 [Ophiobolus disseminans]
MDNLYLHFIAYAVAGLTCLTLTHATVPLSIYTDFCVHTVINYLSFTLVMVPLIYLINHLLGVPEVAGRKKIIFIAAWVCLGLGFNCSNSCDLHDGSFYDGDLSEDDLCNEDLFTT